MSIYTMTRSSIRGIIHGVCRAEVTGLENVPKEGGFIVASNHLSFFDSLIIQALTPARCRVLCQSRVLHHSWPQGQDDEDLLRIRGLHSGAAR